MKNKNSSRLDFAFRVAFLLVYASSLLIPAQTINAAPAPAAQVSAPLFEAPKNFIIGSQEDYKAKDSFALASAGPVAADGSTPREGVNLGGLFSPLRAYPAPASVYVSNGGLEIEPIAAYNLIVDSNVLSPSSYGPNAATLGAKFCNRSGATMENVWAYIGDYTGSGPYKGTPGLYPVHDPTTDPTFATSFPHLASFPPSEVDYGDPTRFYALEHEAGSVPDATDAARYIGTLADGECRTQYWLVSYPRKAKIGGNWVDVTGGTKPNDDLWLQYDFWATSDADSGNFSYYTRSVTMRNEISAMANKIWPNTDSKVPDQYLNAIQAALGWDTWVEGGGTVAFPGQTAVSQGIWYDFGNVGAGFDNNYDLVPDRNAWVQPIGDASSYDPGCFRLVRTYGVVIVKLNDGSELLIPFVDQMYFENLPANNTGAVGLVYYEYVALDGACSAGLTPYQEVASGYDNEKFNADFGAGIPPLQSQQSVMSFDKTDAPTAVNPGAQVTYTLAYTNVDPDGPGGMSISVGAPTVSAPFVVQDAIPAGTCYVTGSAAGVSPTYPNNLLVDGVQTPSAYAVMYSTDTDPSDGIVWQSVEPTDPVPATACNEANVTYLRWLRNDLVANGSTGQVQFKVFVPATYVADTGKVTIENTGCLKLGEGLCFKEDTETTAVAGSGSINGYAWKDNGGATGVMANALKDGDEAFLPAIGVKLYWDANGDGDYADAGDFLYAETQTLNYNVIDGYIDVNGDSLITAADNVALAGVTVIDGALDMNNDGVISALDGDNGLNIYFFAGFRVYNGRIDVNRSGASDGSDDGSLAGYYNFASLPATNATDPKYILVLESLDPDVPAGYGPTTPITYKNIEIGTTTAEKNYGDAASEPTNFGFAPALSVTKRLATTSPTTGGQPVQFALSVTNNLLGSGDNSSVCKYYIWASVAHQTTGVIPPGGSIPNGVFTNVNNALGRPDDKYSFSNIENNTDYLGLSGFNIGNLGGTITKVEFLVDAHERKDFKSTDNIYVQIYYNDAPLGSAYTYNGGTYFTGPVNAQYYLSRDITSLRSWTWADFQNNLTEMQIKANKGSGPGTSGDIDLDAAAYVITTNGGTCGGDAQTLNPVPLVDAFDNTRLTFVSANPPISSQSTSGSETTLSWNNVGPLYPGQTREILVDFIAKDMTSATTTTNLGESIGAKFSTGLSANSDLRTETDNQASVVINPTGTLSGVIYGDADNSGWTAGATGYNTGDTFLQGVTVNLYACEWDNGSGYITPGDANYDSAKSCVNQKNGGVSGRWTLTPVKTAVTDSSGAYNFTGLLPAFYYVRVASGTLPTGYATQSSEPLPNGTGQTCGTCNHIWEPAGAAGTYNTAALSVANFNNLTAGENIANVNFGYKGNAIISGNVWQDFNGDATKQTTDTGVGTVTVTLRNCGADNVCGNGDDSTTTTATDSSGNYQFTNLTAGRAYQVSVDTGTLPAGATWTQTDEDKGGVNDNPYNNNLITFVNVQTNTAYTQNDFGFTRAGSYVIGDTLFYDWNGNAVKDAIDEGIKDITVYLYEDLNANGVIDASDPLVATAVTDVNGMYCFGGTMSGGICSPGVNGLADGRYIVNVYTADPDFPQNLNQTRDPGEFVIIDGYLDLNGYGISASDDTLLLYGKKIIDGAIDMNADNVINASDTGTYLGFNVYNGRLDTSGNGGVGAEDDLNLVAACNTCDSQNNIIISGASNLEQDFGYEPIGVGTIGDYVFKDADGDGIKDSGEAGIAGIKVRLEVDLNGDGTYVALEEQTTDSSGYYLFSSLPVGTQYNYRVVLALTPGAGENYEKIPSDAYGYKYFNATGTLDSAPDPDIIYINATITPAAPNYLNADFGFAPRAAIGDTVYQDINGNATQDNNEPGINGVTVNLYSFTDSNGNNRYDPGETLGSLVASAVTAYDPASGKDGVYKFAGLTPGYYVVVVDDTDPDLSGAILTGDPNADGVPCDQPLSGVCDHREGMRLYAGTNYTGADFGYQLPGFFGDQLWIDADGNGKLDVGESPIANITITAQAVVPANTTITVNGVTYTPGQTVALTTVSDVNGNYTFQGIQIGGSSPANVSWTVSVDTADTDFPSGASNTYDSDGAADNSTAVIMTPSGTIQTVGGCSTTPNGCDGESDALALDVDFGYRFVGATNISGTICLESTTQDGVCGTSATDPSGIGPGEIPYSSITVYLYRLVDNPGGTTGEYDSGIDDVVLVGVANTAANGDYSFSSVANGVYYIIAIGAPQSGISLTSTNSSVNSGGDGAYTTQYSETKTADGVTTLSAFQVVDATAPGGVTIADRDFAFEAPVQYDYGDLPAIFEMSSVGDDGARHVVTPSLYLGPVSGGAPDADADGYASVSASSDDNIGSDDENGVTFPTNWTNSTTAGNANFNYAADGGGSVTVDVQGSGYLLAWIDINGDGLFSNYDQNGDGDYNDYLDSNSDGDAKDSGEWYEYKEFIINQAVSTGTYTFNFQIPYGTLSATQTTFNMRFRLFPSQPPAPALAYKGTASGGEVEDYQVNAVLSQPPTESPHTTPVTLSYFHAQRKGSKVNFNWATATETGNVGFNLYVESLGQLVKINSELIPSAAIDTLETQEYAFSADMTGYVFYIEDVDVFGESRKYGPFRADVKYGSQLDAEKIDQLAIQQEYAAAAARRESQMQSAMALPPAARRSPILSRSVVPQIFNTLNLKVSQTGLYRITYEQLRDAGLDLLRVPAAKIALSNRGKFIPATVSAPNAGRSRGLFGPGGYIEFYGQALDTLYTDENIYTVQVLSSAATRLSSAPANPSARVPVETSFTETVTINNQNRYAYFAPGRDVWYDKAMSVAKGAPKSWDWNFNVANLTNGPQTLEVTLWGVNDTPSLTPDHSVVILLNGVEVAREKFNGLMEKVVKVNLPAGLLKEGENALRVAMPADTRAPADIVALDKFSVTYQRSFKAADNQLTFTSAGKSFKVTNLSSDNVVVYRVDGKGATRLNGLKTTSLNDAYSVAFAGTGKTATYIVSAVSALPVPETQATRLAVNLNQPAQYLIISHPHFIDGLQPLVAAKQAQGFTVSVVDVYDLYQQYTYGVFDPSAIKAYIAYATKNLGTKYVLLVGGDSYDYRDYLKKGSLSFIPSLYAATGSQYAKFAPVDPLYADIDNDLVPDLAIGRFPVRTRAELDLMIQKTLAYSAKEYGGTAFFASDKFDGSASFKQIVNRMTAGMPASWTTATIHLDDMDVASARVPLLNAMNSGTALVSYAGHSGAASWTFSGLFNSADAKNLTNAGKPFVVVQWGCWNTYYVDPLNEYMVQSFLFAGDKGAAAVLGAVTLTDSTSERKLGELLTPRMTAPGATLGQALLDAKKELAKTDPKLIDVLLGWTLMGDPALVVQP